MSISKYVFEEPSHKKVRKIQQADIAFDLDGIVLDTATEMWKVVTKHIGVDWPISQWTDYELESITGLPLSELRPIYEPVLARNNIPEVPGAAVALNNLFHKYQEPLLFITARRIKFEEAAYYSLTRLLDSDVEFEVIYQKMGDLVNQGEYKKNKLDILQHYGVRLFVEDNWMHWEEYIDNGIQVVTLDWPWTIGRVIDLACKGKTVRCLPGWKSLYMYLDAFMEIR
jgi:hypothetical protein